MREKINEIVLAIIIFLVATMLTVRCYSQNDTLIDRGIYKVKYSQKYKQPIKLQYSVYKYTSNFHRGHQDFYVERGIITSTAKDYKDNDYDKGHLAPAETFSNTKENLYKTFSYLNCALQHQDLNRGLWKKLESDERKWAQTDSLVIFVELEFQWPDGKDRKTKNGTKIPFYFKKTVYFTKSNRIITFVFPNIDCGSGIEKYKTSDGKPSDFLLKRLIKF